MAAYRQVYDSHHLQADCQEPASAPELYTTEVDKGCPMIRMGQGEWVNVSSGTGLPR